MGFCSTAKSDMVVQDCRYKGFASETRGAVVGQAVSPDVTSKCFELLSMANLNQFAILASSLSVLSGMFSFEPNSQLPLSLATTESHLCSSFCTCYGQKAQKLTSPSPTLLQFRGYKFLHALTARLFGSVFLTTQVPEQQYYYLYLSSLSLILIINPAL